ncbi:26S proteasome non-ATPase regulatory subunit 4-like protein [Dinothrombium tinctorium]|uniref:26S proteasome non-ATPase regulatory subunit 4 n=1 Tax=Dinothrombium tinctorium TaxID=1965070 RepID=A0A443R2T6_9ACAR|nr:26S proteasome non-ATPase regulatory subunit 4-like protein [Dinothrombium tinctorium]
MVCVDNSEFMRNADFPPTRLQAQEEAVSIICHSKTRSNPENNVGLLTLSNAPQVLTTLTTDVGRILAKLHQVQPNGSLNFATGIRIAHLALKHRQGKNHKMRIIVFIGSPLQMDEKELVKLAKRLKKEKVNVDIVNFGEEQENMDKLSTFIKTLNGEGGSGSHLVTIPPCPHLSDALITSPIVQGEDGSGAVGIGAPGFEFGIDPNEDPELALALRVSMEEQRARQEQEARAAAAAQGASAAAPSGGAQTPTDDNKNLEEALLEKALAMSFETSGKSDDKKASTSAPTTSESLPDFSTMSEAEQIRYALEMSLQPVHQANKTPSPDSPVPMETDDVDQKKVMISSQN